MSLLAAWLAPKPEALGATPEEMLARLEGPTVVHVPGRDRQRARVVVTLLHGNEPSGLRAIHGWLAGRPQPAVDLYCVLAAVEAARLPPVLSHRMPPGARDLNRAFRPPYEGAEGALAEAVVALVRDVQPEALVDLHNNTGHNPPYSVATVVDAARLHLTWLFASRLVHSTLRLGALTEVLADELPAVTIECGQAGDAAADAAALAGLARFASQERFDWDAAVPRVQIFERPLRVTVPGGTRVAFGERPVSDAALTMTPDADRHNFCEVPAGTMLGWADALPIEVQDEQGRDVASTIFRVVDGRLETRAPVVPIMMTTDARIAVQDCLCYLVSPRGA